jgi:Uma2 family endonuclease
MSADPTVFMTADEFFDWAKRPENDRARMHVHRGRVFPAFPHFGERLAVTSVLTDYVFRRGRGEVAWLAEAVVFERDPLTAQMPDVMLFDSPSPRDDFPPRVTTGEIPLLMVELCAPLWSQANRSLQRATVAIEHGVGMVWHLIPDDRELIVYVDRQSPKVFGPLDEITGFGVLPDFVCKVADLFTPPGQQPSSPPTA